jgi:uncharacterized protein YdeI (YjbR/CyaY-like superfamily)
MVFTMELYFALREDWRAWLEAHHGKEREVWLVFYKKHTGKPSLSYDAAVEEALCFGWIDSLIKRLDDERYARKFTPRKDRRRWSASNLKRIEKLKAEGRMTAAGMAMIPADVEAEPAASKRSLEPPDFFLGALEASPAAAEYFATLAPSYRRNFIHWVASAKREATRQRRLSEAISLLAEGKKLGMK